jgi:thioredoxin reductase
MKDEVLLMLLSYYCMFCFGYEQRGSPSAGVLAIGTLAHPDHAITNARDASKFAEVTTIYTDGNSALQSQLLSKVNGGIQVNNERIRRLVQPKSGGGIVIEFHSGDKRNLSFLVHKPDLEVERSLPDQLGVECVPGFGIKVTPPFNKTNIAGVYAAGDCCSPLRNIPNAQSMGSFAGCGLARELPRRL